MKIVSSFSDYYDGLMAMGHDDSLIYNRKTVEYDREDKDIPQLIKDISNLKLHATNRKRWDGTQLYSWDGPVTVLGENKQKWHIARHVSIIFCGKPYVALKFTSEVSLPPNYKPSETEYFYNEEQVFRFCQAKGIDLGQTSKERTWPARDADLKSAIKTFFMTKELDKDWLIENKVICIVKDMIGTAPQVNSIIVNPCLKDYQFARAIDPYQAWQELEMWIGGTLAWPQNSMVEISDESKVKKHGFDSKYGFRTRPSSTKGKT